METNSIEDRVKFFEIKMCEFEESQVKISDLTEICLDLKHKSGDKKSPPGTKSPRGHKSGDKKSPPGTKSPQEQKSGDFLSPECLDWSQPWKPIVGPVFKPAKSYWDFEKKYMCRPKGPTKHLSKVVALLMEFPENNNFYIKSKRCYVRKNHKWELRKPSDFYPELREKILTQYHDLLLRSQSKEVEAFAAECLQRASLTHMTNQKMEKLVKVSHQPGRLV